MSILTANEASQFSYSGDKMENITQKLLMGEIIFGTKPNFEKILFSKNEK
ncbi:hypothetical protein [Flavobacterium sp. WC2509]